MKQLITLFVAALSLPHLSEARSVLEPPHTRQATSFAIVADRTTYERTAPQLRAYRDALEADGLSAYILADDWRSPEEVREALLRLRRRCASRSPLEGAVFVGEIPIAMIRNGQHLTTAFKMDERAFPMNRSSVPSDRFYDCPDLRFDFVARDTSDRALFYYNLSDTSPQRLAPAFYTGRIRYPERLGGDRYRAIARYLAKVVEERRRADRLDHVVTYAGDGYNSDCLVCWMDERIGMEEHFPLTRGREADRLRQLNFRMDGCMKHALFDELERPEVDLMLFNEHGSPDKQHVGSYATPPDCLEGIYGQLRDDYLRARYYELRKGASGDPESLRAAFGRQYRLTDAFFASAETPSDRPSDRPSDCRESSDPSAITLDELAGLPVQPRVVIFNACYNGSFHLPGNVAGYYLFGPGRTVAAQGNTVNVLQDRWTCELSGLLSHGVRVGAYNRLVATLEGHILGDPAFRFRPVEPNDVSASLTLRAGDVGYWRSLARRSPYADLRSLSLRMLAEAGDVSPGELLDTLRRSTFATTRLESLVLLGRTGDEDAFAEGVRLGLRDRYEAVRRMAAIFAWQLGRIDLLPDMARSLVEDDESRRVAYVLLKGLTLLPDGAVDEALRAAVDRADYADPAARLAELRGRLAAGRRAKASDREALLHGGSLKVRIAAVRSMRNNTYHEYLDELLGVVSDRSEPAALRLAVAECLGWFVHTPRRDEVVAACRRLAAGGDTDPTLRGELLQTALRLESARNIPKTRKNTRP